MATQDMPPPGGFGSIHIDRVAPRPLLRHGILFGIGMAVSVYGWLYTREWKKRYRVLKAEMNEHFVAVHPFLLAEQERKFMLRLWYLRENEKELMKDVPNWKIGTLYGERLFKSLPLGVLPPVSMSEYLMHRSTDEWFWQVRAPDWYK